MPATECQHCGGSLPDGVSSCPDCGESVRSGRRTGFRFATGAVIDNRYEVLHRIPGGGMGELYKVRHLHLHDVRAIKILRSDQIGDKNYRERFLREARIAASIKHPNVALLHDFATLPDKSFYMVEEFIEGTTLARCLRDGRRFSLNEIVDIAQQVLLGLGAIHERGIIHRDISPDNIMLADSPSGGIRVKIIDLGIARSVDPSSAHSLTSAGLFIGKPHYASPEQMRLIEDDRPIDHRTDLYSLGVVLYEVVSGKVPFEASTPFEYLMKQLSGDSGAVDRSVADLVPPDLEKFIVKLLRAKREDRYDSTVDALLALSKVRVGQATIQDMPVGQGDAAAYPVSAPSKKRRQTAEVPIEQLRKLIEQDRPEAARDAVLLAPQASEPDPGPTEIRDFDDSQKITVVQAVLPTQEVQRPSAPVDETERVPLPVAGEESEPVAFVPDLPAPETPVPEPAPEPPPIQDSSSAPPTSVEPRRRSGPNPIAWFVAGIIFVAIVSAGGYLLYRWLDASFGKAPEEDPPATSSAAPATNSAPAIESAAETSGEIATDTTPEAPSRERLTSTAEPALREQPARVEPATTAPKAPESTSSPTKPETSTPPPPRPSTVQPPKSSPPARIDTKPDAKPDTTPDETPVSTTKPAEPEPPAEVETASPANAPVVLPGSTDDVREGDLVAPGPGVTPPEVIKTVEPIYPPLSSNMGYEGFAMFSVLVGPDGKVEVAKLIVSTGNDPLDESAADAARQTQFKPATKNGVKVRMWKTLRFQFKKTRGF